MLAPAAPVIDPADHLLFARNVAISVAKMFGRVGQERDDLVAMARLVVCEYAPRFAPVLAFRRWSAPPIEGACADWQRTAPVPVVSGPALVAGEDQTLWVAGLAAGVANRRGFRRGTCERGALVVVGLRVAAERAVRFDPLAAFRGWVVSAVWGACRREAIALQNGGLFRTSASDALNRVKVGGLTRLERRGDGEHERAGEPVVCDTTLSRDYRFAEPDEPDDPDEFDTDDDGGDCVALAYRKPLVPAGSTAGWRQFLARRPGQIT